MCYTFCPVSNIHEMQVVVLYDISPMAVMVTRKGKHWYEFITSLCALIGCGNLSGLINPLRY